MYVFCSVQDCEHRDENGFCGKDKISISDNDFTAAGFLPICEDYSPKHREFEE